MKNKLCGIEKFAIGIGLIGIINIGIGFGTVSTNKIYYAVDTQRNGQVYNCNLEDEDGNSYKITTDRDIQDEWFYGKGIKIKNTSKELIYDIVMMD